MDTVPDQEVVHAAFVLVPVSLLGHELLVLVLVLNRVNRVGEVRLLSVLLVPLSILGEEVRVSVRVNSRLLFDFFQRGEQLRVVFDMKALYHIRLVPLDIRDDLRSTRTAHIEIGSVLALPCYQKSV